MIFCGKAFSRCGRLSCEVARSAREVNGAKAWKERAADGHAFAFTRLVTRGLTMHFSYSDGALEIAA
jgi:hypothetical protein